MPDRAGTEPASARSPLRLRMALAVFGFLVCVAAAVWAWSSRDDVDRTAMSVLGALAALGALIAVVDLAVVARRWRHRP
jgi:membrane protein YdbS with pleckstrin-like domain